MKNFKRMMRRTWKNKVAALALAAGSIVPVIMFPNEDATGSLFLMLFAVPLFFEKKNVVY